MESGHIKVNSVRMYGGWGDYDSGSYQKHVLAHTAAVDEIQKAWRKRPLLQRKFLMKKLRSVYQLIGESLLDPGNSELALNDGYLQAWEKALELEL